MPSSTCPQQYFIFGHLVHFHYSIFNVVIKSLLLVHSSFQEESNHLKVCKDTILGHKRVRSLRIFVGIQNFQMRRNYMSKWGNSSERGYPLDIGFPIALSLTSFTICKGL